MSLFGASNLMALFREQKNSTDCRSSITLTPKPTKISVHSVYKTYEGCIQMFADRLDVLGKAAGMINADFGHVLSLHTCSSDQQKRLQETRECFLVEMDDRVHDWKSYWVRQTDLQKALLRGVTDYDFSSGGQLVATLASLLVVFDFLAHTTILAFHNLKKVCEEIGIKESDLSFNNAYMVGRWTSQMDFFVKYEVPRFHVNTKAS